MSSNFNKALCFFTILETFAHLTANIFYHLRKHWKFWVAYQQSKAKFVGQRVNNILIVSTVCQPAGQNNPPDVIHKIPRSRHEITFSLSLELPAQDRVFHILSSRISMARKCDKSPANLNTFILCVVGFKLRN